MTANDHELLTQFTSGQSQDAFTALVNRHVNLVYSAALRQVRSPQLAEEVAQNVFSELARQAASLKADTILTAWLYQVTRNTAIDVVRRESRRQAREQIAFQMSVMNDTSAEWTQVEPLLDEAMQSLEPADRAAILLRYFENKSLREVGQAIGASEDAAQKRVSRAVEHLRQFFSERKVPVGVSGLVALLSANAVQAAPAGLAASIVGGAAVVSSTISASTAITVTKTIAMTTVQKTIIATVAAAAVVVGVFQARQVSNLRDQVQTLQQQQTQLTGLSNQVDELQRQRDRATSSLAQVSAEFEAAKRNPEELLKLRGELGKVRSEKKALGATSGLSKLTSNPESRKMMRDQQKMGMSMLYKEFGDNVKLNEEQKGKFHDLLADHIMDNVDNVTAVLRDKQSPAEMDKLFAAQDAALEQKVQELLGADAVTQFRDYNKNLLSSLTSAQFKGMLSGTDEEKEKKSKQLSQLVEQEKLAVLAGAGLPADYQAIPMLNFRNIASESLADTNLKLLDDIYQRVATQSASFLSPEELEKWNKFKGTAITNNRTMLTINRSVMAPIAN